MVQVALIDTKRYTPFALRVNGVFYWKDSKLLTGLMSYIDDRLLAYYEMKRNDAHNRLQQAKQDRDQLLSGRAALVQAKAAHEVNAVVRYRQGWVNCAEAEEELKILTAPNGRLRHATYERYGTNCARVKRRIAQRASKVSHRSFGSRTA